MCLRFHSHILTHHHLAKDTSVQYCF